MRYRYWYVPPCKSQRELDFERVQAVLDGDEEAWDELYQEAYQTVVRCAARADRPKLLTAADYQDAADRAFAQCYEELERYHGWGRFAYWVGGYARNFIRNQRRREQTRLRNRRLLNQAAVEKMAECDPMRVVIRLERDQCLWGAFYELPHVDQKIVSKVLFDGIAPKCIARELALTRKEIVKRYKEALISIRVHFLRRYCRGCEE